MAAVIKTKCQLDDIATGVFLQLFERIRYINTGTNPKLTNPQKSCIVSVWHHYIKGDSTRAGMAAFQKMFELFPITKEKFAFARESAAGQLQNSARVIFHVTRVIKYITKVVENMDNLEDVVPMLKQVGGRHGTRGYNIPEAYFPHLRDALCDLMKKEVPQFSQDCEEGFCKVMNWIFEQMVAGQKEYNVDAR